MRDNDEEREVQLQVIDILYDKEVCSLVYMQDLTQVLS